MKDCPENYRCKECDNMALYGRDHKPDCIYFPDRFRGRKS